MRQNSNPSLYQTIIAKLGLTIGICGCLAGIVAGIYFGFIAS